MEHKLTTECEKMHNKVDTEFYGCRQNKKNISH